MKFLIDAQLPRGLAAQFRQAGLEAIHTLDLPDGNRTTDRTINELALKERYVVVTGLRFRRIVFLEPRALETLASLNGQYR